MKTNHRYFPVNDAQRAWGLYVTCVGKSQTEPDDEFPSATHPDEYFFTWDKGRILNEWQLSLIERGRGVVEFRNRRYSAKEGSLIVLPPGCWHRFRPSRRTGWTTLWFGFGGDLAARLIGGAGFSPEGEVRNISYAKRFHRLLSKAATDILECGRDSIYSAAARIPSLVAALIEERPCNATGSTQTELVHRAQSYIAGHATETVDFATLAESLGLPYRTLRYQFAKETGTSPLQYQLDIRLARAKNLLRTSDMPISEIAEALGFNSTWYFSHFFQQRTRMSPAAFRRRTRQDASLPM